VILLGYENNQQIGISSSHEYGTLVDRYQFHMNLYDSIGHVYAETVPPQGMTSTVTLLVAEKGQFALKQADRAPFVDWLKREATMLQALAHTPLPVPRLIALEEQPASAALLMTALPGEPLSQYLCRGVSKARRLDLLEQFGRTLAAIHHTPSPVRLQVGQPWLDRILAEARHNLQQGYAEPDAPSIDDFAAASPPTTPEVLIHGDYTIDNVLVDHNRISGIIDWSRGDMGDRRYDLVLATRPQGPEAVFLEEVDFAAFYTGYGDKRITEREYRWFYDLYAYF
jgi:aminoglycoside phosphotransferase (APT) family kinase protein